MAKKKMYLVVAWYNEELAQNMNDSSERFYCETFEEANRIMLLLSEDPDFDSVYYDDDKFEVEVWD